MFIKFQDFMGDREDSERVNLIGPFPDAAARTRGLARLRALPLGSANYNGGYIFDIATEENRADRVVSPTLVSCATTVQDFYDLFYDRRKPDADSVQQFMDWVGLQYRQCIVAARATTASDYYATCNGRAEAYHQAAERLARLAGMSPPDFDRIRQEVPADGIYRDSSA